MTFACKNHEFDTDTCKKLNSDCIMGRKGCVLEGKVKLTEDMEKRVLEIEDALKERIATRRNTEK